MSVVNETKQTYFICRHKALLFSLQQERVRLASLLMLHLFFHFMVTICIGELPINWCVFLTVFSVYVFSTHLVIMKDIVHGLNV